MEWVQTTAKTVEEAKDLALDQLGVAEDDAEFEVLEEPRPGLFGRVRGEARVRARVRPSRPRPKVDRRERRRRDPAAAGQDTVPGPVEPLLEDAAELDVTPEAATANGDESEARPDTSARRPPRAPRAPRKTPATVAATSEPSTISESVRSGDGEEEPAEDSGAEASSESVGPNAAAFLEGLAAAFGVEASTAIGGGGSELEVRLDGVDLGLLIGPRGQTLLAVQDLTRTVSQRGVVDHGRLHIDIGGYRERRRAALARFTTDVAQQVISSGVPRMLEAMTSADRKVVHDTAATIDGVETRSEGEEPNRRVVVAPTETPAPS